VRAFGARNGYLTDTYIVRKGITYSIIARVYNEVPSTLIYDRAERYTFPGKLGVNNGVPVGTPAVTRQIAMEIEESYAVGELAASALEFEVLAWASGSVDFTTDGNDGSKSFSFPGVIGQLSISASNVYFAGYLCDTLAGVIESNPSAYPSGKKRISSVAFPWKGDIWKKVTGFSDDAVVDAYVSGFTGGTKQPNRALMASIIVFAMSA